MLVLEVAATNTVQAALSFDCVKPASDCGLIAQDRGANIIRIVLRTSDLIEILICSFIHFG